jgi:hypothetical protein
MSSKYLSAALLVAISIASLGSGDRGFVEGHLSILPAREAELDDVGSPVPITSTPYAEYPLVVRSRDGKQEFARLLTDNNGNYRAELPPGDYLLDVQHGEQKHLRVRPQMFTIAPGKTVHVDMHIDTGVR